jgi:flagellar motor switch protein FliN/FliY
VTSPAHHMPVSLLDRAPEALRAAALAAGRPLPVGEPITADQPRLLTDAMEDLAGADAQALAVSVTGAAAGTVTLVVAGAVAQALQDGPLGAADLTAALISPVTDAVAELEQAFPATLHVGVADAVEAHAIGFGPEALAVPLTAGGANVAVLVVELSADDRTAVPVIQEVGDELAAFTPLVDHAAPVQQPRSLDLLHDVEMAVTVELGRTRMAVRDLLALAPGAVVELDRAAGSPVDVLVNGKLIARGEVVVIDDDFGIRITEIIGLHSARP